MAHAREQDRPSAPQGERGQKRIVVHTSAGKAAASKANPDVAEVPVSETRFKRIAGKSQYLRKLVANYADSVATAVRTGQPTTVVLRVLPSGEIAPVDLSESAAAGLAVSRPAVSGPAVAAAPTIAASEQRDALDIALAAAKARGQAKVAEILKGEDMLTAREFGPLIGASHETVRVKRERFELLGLEGATRGVRYPRWQVTDDGLPLPGLPQLFAVLGPQPWTVHRFLRTAHAELGGRTALEALKAGQVEAVLGAARNQVAGHFA
ncbi:hypothetical protein [Methylobacterium sp. CM6257]